MCFVFIYTSHSDTIHVEAFSNLCILNFVTALYSEEQLLDTMCMALGGRVAEEVCLCLSVCKFLCMYLYVVIYLYVVEYLYVVVFQHVMISCAWFWVHALLQEYVCLCVHVIETHTSKTGTHAHLNRQF